MKSAVFLYNAQSGRGRIRRNVERVCDVFREGGYDILPVPIDFGANPFDGHEQIDLMVVAGGDGTVNFVVNAMKQKGLDIPVGIIPAGTANDFAKALGMSDRPLEAARQIAFGRVDRVDCGRVNNQYFVNVLSFGIFTTTSQHTPEGLKHRIGRLAYLVAGLKDLKNLHSIPLTIATDEETFEYQTLMGLVFNGETAGRVPLARNASLRDGVFDCLFLRKRNPLLSACDMLLYVLGINTGAVRSLRTGTLTLTTPVSEDTDVDGQRGGKFPMRVKCLHGDLNVICPSDRAAE